MDAQHHLAARFAAVYPAEAARRLETAPADEVAAFLSTVSPGVAVDVIDRMLPTKVAAALEWAEGDESAAILTHLSLGRCVVVLRAVAKAERTRLVNLLPEKIARQVTRLLRAPEGSAGVIAEPVPAELFPEMSVGQAVRVVSGTTVSYLYVVDDEHRLIGVIHRRDLLGGDERARVGDVMNADVVRLPLAAPQTAIRNHRAWLQLDALPVVDRDGVLVGVIRHKRVRRPLDAPSEPATGRASTLAAFLDLGELYWGSLASLMTAMACHIDAEDQQEVKRAL